MADDATGGKLPTAPTQMTRTYGEAETNCNCAASLLAKNDKAPKVALAHMLQAQLNLRSLAIMIGRFQCNCCSYNRALLKFEMIIEAI